jgi:hypothetical protein
MDGNTPDIMSSILLENLGEPYERNPLTLFKAVIRGNSIEDLSSVFCSELVALVLKQTGYLVSEKLDANYLPKDFTCEPGVTLDLMGAYLSDMFVAVPDASNDNNEVAKPRCGGCVLI